MKKFLLYFLLLLFSCNTINNPKEEILKFSEIEYLCDDYIIEDNQYSFNAPASYNLRIIEYAESDLDVDVNAVKLVKFLNNGNHRYKGFDQLNVYFNLNGIETVIVEQIASKPIRYRDLLHNTWRYHDKESIILIVLPDNAIIYEGESILGAAYGIPPLEGNNRAKPVMFVKKELLYTGVLFHEMSHVFGLHHIFKDNDQLHKGYNCTQGDMAVDTPTPAISSGVSQSCTYYPGVNDSLSTKDISIVTSNYMNYIPPTCMRQWEESQKQIMRKVGYYNPLLEQTKVQLDHYDIFVSD